MKITHKQLNILGDKFLRTSVKSLYKCQITRIELVTGVFETPDVIGFYSGRSVLIESKTNRMDFLNDKKKIHRNGVGIGDYRLFLCKEGVINEEDLYDDWGLLHTDGKKVWVVADATYRIDWDSGHPRDKTNDTMVMYSIMRRYKVDKKKSLIEFGDWLSANFNIENGIGYWSDFSEEDRQYTTQELLTKYIKKNEI